MKKLLLSLLLLPSLLFAQQNGFTINGTAVGFNDGADVKLAQVNDNAEIARAKIMKGKFTITGSVFEPGLFWLILDKEQPQHIYLENSRINIAANKAAIKEVKITGSKSHNDFDDFRKIFNPLIGELNGTAALLNRTPGGPQWDSLKAKYDSVNKLIQVHIDKYIAVKRSSFVSPFLLFITAQMYDNPLLMESRYMLLDTAVRNSQIGRSLFEYIQYYKVGAIGTSAIDFVQPDTSGTSVALSSFRGKYVLVDFWASWCGPCRNENPNVVASFQKFKDKNFTVLGVSLDKPGGKENWIKAINQDGLTWTHVSDLKQWDNAAAQLYHVQGIPFNLLIDPNGKIIAKNLRSTDLQNKLCEVLGGCN
ncbi:MAG: AhpC/TSA family protein [Bacteroidota bacterium]|nr:AhpC/TSA family protein [Bacteroidota bacterium]